jgi:thiamine monophosphate synthase
VTDAAVLSLPDFPVRAAALAAAGSAVALHARDRAATSLELARVTDRLLALARPPEAAVFVDARADIAAALDAQGVQLGRATDAGKPQGFPEWRGWIGASVHSAEEARESAEKGADFLMVGSIYPSASHPGQPAAGPRIQERRRAGRRLREVAVPSGGRGLSRDMPAPLRATASGGRTGGWW